MTGADLCVNKPVTVPVIFEPPCKKRSLESSETPVLYRGCTVPKG